MLLDVGLTPAASAAGFSAAIAPTAPALHGSVTQTAVASLEVDRVLAARKTRAYEHKDTVRIGRSHGIHAEPTTMGLTFARFYAEMARGKAHAEQALHATQAQADDARAAFDELRVKHERMGAKVAGAPQPRSVGARARSPHLAPRPARALAP